MTIEEVKELQYHDEVLWTDPDNDECTRVYTIQTIVVTGDVVHITDLSGDELECFCHELS